MPLAKRIAEKKAQGNTPHALPVAELLVISAALEKTILRAQLVSGLHEKYHPLG